MTVPAWPTLNYNVVNLPEIQATIFAPNMGSVASPYTGSAIAYNSGSLPPGWPSGVSFSEGVPVGSLNNQGGPANGPIGADIYCSGPVSIFPGQTAAGRVGFAGVPGDNRAVCAWADPNNEFRITLSYRNAQGIWQQPFALGEKSFQGVDVGLDGANAWSVLLAWTGTDEGELSSGTINFGAMPFGYQNLTLKKTFEGQTALGSPSVTVSDLYTFIAWTGTNPAHNLNLLMVQPTEVSGSTVWSFSQSILDEFSECPPRLAWILGNQLALTWLGTDGELNLLTLDPNSGLGTKYIANTSVGSSCAPTVLLVGWWYMAWVNANDVWVTCSQTIGSPNAAWDKALGLGAAGTLPSVDGVAFSWDLTGDGLQLGYRSLGSSGAPAANGPPCVSSISLDPTQWTK